MKKTIIKRFGENDIGANPDWIVKRRLIDKIEKVPEGWELVSTTDVELQLKEQNQDYSTWQLSQTKPLRNYNSLQDQIALTVTNNPSKSYRIYKYLSSELVPAITDVTLPPKGIDYTISLTPKLKAVRTLDKGFLTSVVWSAVKEDLTEEEVLKVSITYTQADDAPMDSAKTVLSRITTRQWILEDGTYKEGLRDIKVTNKEYPTLIEQNEEGRRRRNNIFIDLSQSYVTLLTILGTNGDIVAAQDIGKQFLSELSTEINDYTNLGSNLILTSIDNLTDTNYLLDTVVPDITPIQGLVPTAISLTIKEFIKKKFKGEI